MGRFSAFDQIYSQAIDWLFPARCAGCGALGEHWCAQCQSRILPIAEPVCELCGTPLLAKGGPCSACSQHQFAFTAARSRARYAGELRQAILELKRRKNESLGLALALEMANMLQAQEWKIDVIIPIPLAPQRLAERGYNQAELLATPIAKAMKLTLAPAAMQRLVETQPQKGLTVRERWANMSTAFAANSAQVHGLNVLVIDDIMTTGATLNAAAAVLKGAGAKSVYAATLARTLLEGDSGFW